MKRVNTNDVFSPFVVFCPDGFCVVANVSRLSKFFPFPFKKFRVASPDPAGFEGGFGSDVDGWNLTVSDFVKVVVVSSRECIVWEMEKRLKHDLFAGWDFGWGTHDLSNIRKGGDSSLEVELYPQKMGSTRWCCIAVRTFCAASPKRRRFPVGSDHNAKVFRYGGDFTILANWDVLAWRLPAPCFQ